MGRACSTRHASFAFHFSAGPLALPFAGDEDFDLASACKSLDQELLAQARSDFDEEYPQRLSGPKGVLLCRFIFIGACVSFHIAGSSKGAGKQRGRSGFSKRQGQGQGNGKGKHPHGAKRSGDSGNKSWAASDGKWSRNNYWAASGSKTW